MAILTSEYWNDRYINDNTGWDIGHISTPLKAYFDQFEHKSAKILIPGAGNSHEAIYLWEKGFKNIYILDWAQLPLANIRKNIDIPKEQTIEVNFFDFEGSFDLIIEQTFFCAIDPSLRDDYVKQCSNLLNDNGKLVGLLFDELREDGPPFGGTKSEYEKLFSPKFEIQTLERAYNSIEPRKDRELFMILKKKSLD